MSSRRLHRRGAIASSIIPSVGATLDLGGLLPSRMPASTGTVRQVSTHSQFVSALAASSAGDIVELTANIDGSGQGELGISRTAAALAPITIRSPAGVANRKKFYNYANGILLNGQYLRFQNIEHTAGKQVKIDGNDLDIDKCLLHTNTGFGTLFGHGSFPSNIQIWDTIMHTNGSDTSYDHNIYTAYVDGNSVIANCLFYNGWAYNMQIYPDAHDLIITCCTVYGGQVHGTGGADARGGVVHGGNTTDTPTNCKFIGIISANAPNSAGFRFGSGSDPSVPSGALLRDSISYGNSGGSYSGGTGVAITNLNTNNPLFVNPGAANFRLQAGSPAIDLITPTNYGYVPPFDIEGNARITADAGCYRA